MNDAISAHELRARLEVAGINLSPLRAYGAQHFLLRPIGLQLESSDDPGKTVPDGDTLAEAYRRAEQAAHLRRVVDEAVEEAEQRTADIEVPSDLESTVRKRLEEDPKRTWDSVVAELIGGD